MFLQFLMLVGHSPMTEEIWITVVTAKCFTLSSIIPPGGSAGNGLTAS